MPQPFDDSFSSSAPENYERYFVPAIGEPLARDLVEVAALQPGERVLDVACGTGIVARLAADAVGSDGAVTGVDVNPGMISVARSTGPDEIEWHQANAESLPLPNRAFDAALCQMSLQFMNDRLKALREMGRVVDPGGRVALNVPGPASPLFQILAEAMREHVGPPAAGFVSHVFSLHDTDELRRLLDAADFVDVDVSAEPRTLHLPHPRDFLWQYVHATPLSAMVAAVPEDARRALEASVVERWRPFEDSDGMTYKQRMVSARGRRAEA